MRNLLDTASVAQSLDGERLMGSLHVPNQRIISVQSVHKDRDRQCDALVAEDRRLLFYGAVAEPPPGISFHVRGFIPSTRSTPKDARSKLGNKFKGEK